MIKKLKKRLTLLFICSVMGIFTVVFCLFIHEIIQSKKENEMYFFTRLTDITIMEYRQLSSLRIWILLSFMQSRKLPVLLLY